MYYRINAPRIVHETLDNEVIAIDFEDGSYYSIKKIGALIWLAIDKGASIEQITAQIDVLYPFPNRNTQEEIASFIEQLTQSVLIKVNANAATPSDYVIEKSGAPDSYSIPQLEKHTDLQQLLLLDPIHEVDETAGWPLPKEK